MSLKRSGLFILILVPLFLTGCVETIKEKINYSDSIGNYSLSSELKHELDPQKDMQKYLQEGTSILELTKLEKQLNKYLLHIIESNGLRDKFVGHLPEIKISTNNEFTAESLENGLIVFNTGLLTQLEYEEELYAVIAHELVHILNGHHTKDNLDSLLDKTTKIAMLEAEKKLSIASKSEYTTALSAWAGQTLIRENIGGLLMSKWNREQESEADTLGLELLYKSKINLKGMISFMKKREGFERQHPQLFADSNNVKMEFTDQLSKFVNKLPSFFGQNDEPTEKQESLEVQNLDSLNGNYFSASTRIKDIKSKIKSDYNDYKRTPFRKLKLAQSKELSAVYATRNLPKLIEAKKYTQAASIGLKAISGVLSNNSYTRILMADIRIAQNRNKIAEINLSKAMASKNKSLKTYSFVAQYYEKKNDKQKVLSTLDLANTSLNYPNKYLSETLRLKKKYGLKTSQTEAQCMKTLDLDVIHGCQVVLGRGLDFPTTELLKALDSGELTSSI